MHPELHINFLAVLVAVIVNFIIGSLWYGPIFGKAWRKEMNIPLDFKPEQKEVFKAMGIMVIGSFFTAYVLFYTTNVWRASSWNAGEDQAAWVYGFYSGIYTWIGFYLPVFSIWSLSKADPGDFFHQCWLQLNRSSSSCDDSFLLEMIPVFPRICFN